MQLSTTLPYRGYQPGGHKKTLIWIILFMIVGLMVSHAVIRHPKDAESVRNCISNGGTVEKWHNPETGRVAIVCQLEPKLFGVQIIANIDNTWQEITAFIKNKLTRIEQVHRYLKNTGYQPMK